MLSLPASKPQSPHKGSLGISLREDRTETRLMLSLPAVKPHSPHKRSLGIILREEKARLMLSLPVCKSWSPPERPLGLIFWVKTTLFVGSASKPGSESIRRVSVWSSSKNQTRDLSGGLRGLQTGSESITHSRL